MRPRGARSSLFALLSVGWIAAGYAQSKDVVAKPSAPPPPAQLIVWNRPIVMFRGTVGSVPPAQRARNARTRIDALRESELAKPVAAHAAEFAGHMGIVLSIGEQPVFGVVPEDIDPESGLTLQQLAQHAENQLRAVISAQQQQRSTPLIVRGVILTALSLMALAFFIRAIFAARAFAIRKLDALWRGKQIAIVGIDIIPTLATVERSTLRVLSWAAVLVALYFWLIFALQQFPYTEPLGERLGARVRERIFDSSAALIHALPSIGLIVAVLLITRAVALWARRLLTEIELGARAVSWLQPEQARATRRIAVGFIWILGIAMAYPLLPWSKSLVFQGMSVVLGLGVSLASAGLLNQWISGLVLLYSRSFRVGDFISVSDVEGYVTEIGPLATKLRTMRREEVTLPNAVLTANRLTNMTRLGADTGALLSVSIAVGYVVPWQRVEALLASAARAAKGVRREPPPRVLRWHLDEFAIQYHLHVYLERSEERVAVRSELNSRILDEFTVAGVQIMTPHFESQPDEPVVAMPPIKPTYP